MPLFLTIFNAILYISTFWGALLKFRDKRMFLFLSAFYAAWSVMGIVYLLLCQYLDGESMLFDDIGIFSYLYLYVCTMLLALPFLFQKKVNFIISPKRWVIDWFSIFFIICAVLTYIDRGSTNLTNLQGVLSGDFSTAALYNENSVAAASKEGLNFLTFYRVVFNIFFDIFIFILFYRCTLKLDKKNLFFIVCHVLIILLQVVLILGSAHRGPIFFLIFNIILGILLFYDFFSKKIKKSIFLFSTFTITIGIGVLVFMTITRFEVNQTARSNPLFSTISYSGQSSLYFNKYILDNKVYLLGNYCIPLLRKVVGLNAAIFTTERRILIENTDVPRGPFYTHIGCFCLDFGPIGTFFMLLAIFLFFVKRRFLCTLDHLLILYLLGNVCVQGIMLFWYASYGGNLHLLAYLFMCICIKLNTKKLPITSNNG